MTESMTDPRRDARQDPREDRLAAPRLAPLPGAVERALDLGDELLAGPGAEVALLRGRHPLALADLPAEDQVVEVEGLPVGEVEREAVASPLRPRRPAQPLDHVRQHPRRQVEREHALEPEWSLRSVA